MMLIQYFRWMIFSIFLLFLIGYFKGGSSLLKDIQDTINKTKSLYNTVIILTVTVIVITILISQLLICLGYVHVYRSFDKLWIVLLGAFMMLLSISATYYFRFRFLGPYWKGNVTLHANHQLVNRGPYKIVRHPIYTMMLITYPGIGLSFGNLWNLIACTLVIIGYILITNYEDKFLLMNLSGYKNYQRSTRYRLIPGIW